MYAITLSRRAHKDYDAAPREIQGKVLAAFDMLAEDPFAGKKLRGTWKGRWSFRVWPYRIIYTINRRVITVTVLAIGHRKDVYR